MNNYQAGYTAALKLANLEPEQERPSLINANFLGGAGLALSSAHHAQGLNKMLAIVDDPYRANAFIDKVAPYAAEGVNRIAPIANETPEALLRRGVQMTARTIHDPVQQKVWRYMRNAGYAGVAGGAALGAKGLYDQFSE